MTASTSIAGFQSGSATVAEPGAATRRFLRACAERLPGPVDWSQAPATYKRYSGAARTVLDDGYWLSPLLRGLLGLTRISWTRPHDETGNPLPGNGVVRTGRPAPSGGALYPIEAYPATAAALCHYDSAHHVLEAIRPGDHRRQLSGLLDGFAAGPVPDLVLVLTAVFWRNGFKYQDFAYRLQCQETGILAAQALALGHSLDLDVRVHIGFDGPAADRLLGLEPAAESALAILTFRQGSASKGSVSKSSASKSSASSCPGSDPGPLRDRDASGTTPQPAEPAQPVATRLPDLMALHAATLHAATLREPPASADATDPVSWPSASGPVLELPRALPVRIADGLAHRASPLNGYRPDPMSAAVLSRILTTAVDGYPGDLPGVTYGPRATTLYLLVRNVTGIPPGSYRCQPGQPGQPGLVPVRDQDALAVVAAGPLLPNTRAALRTCAAVLIPVGDPLAGAPRFGDLWYRYQQAETGLIVHRATLAAAALCLTSRIHSDGTNPATDDALGLNGAGWRSLSFLLTGTPRISGPTRTVPARPGRPDRLPAHLRGQPRDGKGETPCPI